MNLDNLGKQLRRDIAAHPKKAAVLALMVLVALYFWGPLAWQWLSVQGGKRSSKVNLASLILTDDPVDPAQQSKVRGSAKFKWERARQLIRDDPRMKPATFDVSWHDPFGMPAGGTDETVQASEAARTTAAAVTAMQADTLGIVLEGVIVGQRSRVATINGEPFREGDIIAVTDKENPATKYRVRVVRIFRLGVELEIGDRRVLLTLEPPKLADGDEIGRNKGKEGKEP